MVKFEIPMALQRPLSTSSSIACSNKIDTHDVNV